MNRLSWDTTAPRRLQRPDSDRRRGEDAVLAASADLLRSAFDARNRHRVGPF